MTSSDRVSSDLHNAKEELSTLINMMGFEASIDVDSEDDEILLHIESEDAGRLIGRGASVLDALQYILNRMLYEKDSEVMHCIVDIERYRERKKKRLTDEAYEAADRAVSTGQPVKLSPMTAGDRRTIHRALEEREGVETSSEALRDDSRKRVVVSPMGEARESAEPPTES